MDYDCVLKGDLYVTLIEISIPCCAACVPACL